MAIHPRGEVSKLEKRPAAINVIWLYMILLSTVVAAYSGRMEATTTASFEGAKNAVTLAIGLIGVMAVWLGIVKVAEAGGLLRLVARIMRPLMVRLFPEVPPEHPAMSAMILNLAANALGLGNAATPMGIKAMTELERLNPRPGTATDAMCLFLAINTSHLALLPTGVIGVRASAGCASPAAILVPSILAASCAMVVAVVAAKWFAKRDPMPSGARETLTEPLPAPDPGPSGDATAELFPPGRVARMALGVMVGVFLCAIPYRLHVRSLEGRLALDHAGVTAAMHWLVPILMCGLLLFGYLRGVKVYEALTEGAKDGFQVAVRIIPYLAAIFVGIAMLRASGTLDAMVAALNPLTSRVGMPAEALPMVFLRPLSGTGAFAFLSEATVRDPNGFVAYLLAVMQGSTETTFYVLAVYFGAVGIRKIRYAVTVGLLADAVGFAAALLFSRLLF
jgi:spore maturation protein SpmA